MKDHEKALFASLGAIGFYLFVTNKPFRKCVIKACQEFAKAVEESSVKPTINTASTAAKKGNGERS